MNLQLLLCSDFDGTLIPDGDMEVSPIAYQIFRSLLENFPITLAIITGRRPQSALDTITAMNLPLPRFLVGDVGSTMLVQEDKVWIRNTDWDKTISIDWANSRSEDILARLKTIPGLTPQENIYQTPTKVSFYGDLDADGALMVNRVRTILLELRVRSQVLWSRDPLRNVAYLDVLPQSAGKLGAMRFIQARFGFLEDRTIYCGDAGNDLDALASGVRAVVPQNAYPEVVQEVLRILQKRKLPHKLYRARGGFLGLQGNALEGVLEGITHHFPEMRQWMT